MHNFQELPVNHNFILLLQVTSFFQFYSHKRKIVFVNCIASHTILLSTFRSNQTTTHSFI